MNAPSSAFSSIDFGKGAAAHPAVHDLPAEPADGHVLARWQLPQLEGQRAESGAALPGSASGQPADHRTDRTDGSDSAPAAGTHTAIPEPDPVAAQLHAQALRIADLESELATLRAGLDAAREAAAAEGRAAGFDEGRLAGQATVEAEGAKLRLSVAAALQAVESTLETRLAALDDRLGDAVHGLVLALGEAVLRTELTISGAPLQRLIDEVLAGMREDLATAVIVLNPADLELLGDVGFATRGDPGLGRGDLRIRTASGDIEASVPDRIAVAMAHLAGNLA